VKAGYVAFAYGGAKEGAFLGKHELIDAVHLTGSAATYDAIVWGSNKAKVLTNNLPLQISLHSTPHWPLDAEMTNHGPAHLLITLVDLFRLHTITNDES
jgi:hypothetical protein